MNDYEVLGLKAGADENEVKRAYFKLVRRFTPEKDPERFQQIRQAYEHLKDGGGEQRLMLAMPKEPFAETMIRRIMNLYDGRDYERAIETAEEAIRYYGEYEVFLYYLAMAQLENGNTGNAVRNFEKLTTKNPDNVFFAKRLALAYLERGYGKKAHSAFAKAYRMGCRDIDFLYDYALNCEDRGDNEGASAVLTKLIEVGSSDLKKNMEQLVDAYSGLFYMWSAFGAGDPDSIWQGFCRFLDDSAPYMSGHEGILKETIKAAIIEMRRDGRFRAEDGGRILTSLRRGLGESKADALWEEMGGYIQLELISDDSRLSDPWKKLVETISYADLANEEERPVVQFLTLDSKLCILEEWPRMRDEVEIIKKDYPALYGLVSDYVDVLDRGNLDYQRRKMLKDYERMGRYLPKGEYEKKYGSRLRQKQPEQVSRMTFEPAEDSEDGPYLKPYVRDVPKIGRNDPCPCGSGKKYKKCCGRQT